jgi:hypothetical protein
VQEQNLVQSFLLLLTTKLQNGYKDICQKRFKTTGFIGRDAAGTAGIAFRMIWWNNGI